MTPHCPSARQARLACRVVLWLACLAACACAGRRVTLPADPGTPLSDFATVSETLFASCRGVRTLTLELSLSGRAGPDRLRGRVLAGFARPDAMRLEGVAPFGAPAFVLAARGDTTTLILPRDNAVLRGTGAAQILGALTGVALEPADLQAIITGCVRPNATVISGRLHQNGWASLDLGNATLYLRRQGAVWQLAAARRDQWEIEYPSWQGAFPQTLRLRSLDDNVPVDVTARLSQLETNVDLQSTAFTVDVPGNARALTLEELRQSGPLRDR